MLCCQTILAPNMKLTNMIEKVEKTAELSNVTVHAKLNDLAAGVALLLHISSLRNKKSSRSRGA